MSNLKRFFLIKLYFFLLPLLITLFFYPFIFFGKFPVPADTIVGMYHPWRDVIWNNLTAGVPFKNYLVTDPVRQQYVWRNLVIEELKKGKLPLWNPYSFSGTPLLANFQTAVFYPLNFLFFIFSFDFAWGLLILLQSLLGIIFMYLFLRQLNLGKESCVLGSVAFIFSGFFIAWLEWNTIGHVVLWLPLTLLSIEKIFENNKFSITDYKISRKFFWLLIFLCSLVFSFFAGHLQIFLYSFIFSFSYLMAKIITLPKNRFKMISIFAINYLLFFIVTLIQWWPTFQFILLSARSVDQGSWLKTGWFLPWQNLIQFISPDFFGNPTTNNYWGIWNYGEFIGYIGIIPLIFALYALFFRFDKKVLFLGFFLFLSLIFALPTPIAKIPYLLNIPLLSSSQPTRLIFIADFSMSVLAAFGFNQFICLFNDKRYKSALKIKAIIIILSVVFSCLWLITLMKSAFFNGELINNLAVSQRNLIFPSLIFISFSLIFIVLFKIKANKIKFLFILCCLFITIFDLLRFAWKFTPFSNKEWIFPSTKVINRLQRESNNFRLMSLDRRIMPPNFSTIYHLNDVSGYDPLYLLSYNQLIASWERDKPDITPGSFNRIITPINFENFITDLLGVKYILSLKPLERQKLSLIESEGTTYLYENLYVFPRAFFVEKIEQVRDKQEEIEKMFNLREKLRYIAVSSENIKIDPSKNSSKDTIKIESYEANYVRIKTKNEEEKLLVLTDVYYPLWKVYIDGQKSKIWCVDFNLRGVIVPPGEHIIEFRIDLI